MRDGSGETEDGQLCVSELATGGSVSILAVKDKEEGAGSTRMALRKNIVSKMQDTLVRILRTRTGGNQAKKRPDELVRPRVRCEIRSKGVNRVYDDMK